MKGYMYILLCSNGKYYTGSTNNIESRLSQHERGEGAKFTKSHLPVQLVYLEEFSRIDEAFYREKQVQGWRHAKKEALIQGNASRLSALSKNYALRFDKLNGQSNSEATVAEPETMVAEPVEANDNKRSIGNIK